jgi:hypothetical protein
MGAVTALLTCLWAWDGRNRPAEDPSVDAAELAPVGSARGSATRQIGESELRALLRNRTLLLVTAAYSAVGYYEYTLF